MKTLISIEEIAMFILALFAFYQLNFAWWVFWALLLVPDVSMVGYLISSKIGAVLYNIVHHKALAVAIYILGFYLSAPMLQLAGIILFAHSNMDRALGYGLKYFTGFKDTHLGKIGKNN